MADRGLIHYQPLTGPVWREPVASRMAWLPRGEPARPLERRVPSEFVYPPFYELYNPAGLHWLPSGRWPLYPEVRKLGDFQQPPFQALYKPEQLGWMPPTLYLLRTSPRATLDSTVSPVQFAAPAFDPRDLEWIPKGTPPQTLSEIRKLGDFVQPAFDGLYKPEGLQWLFEGQPSVRGIPYTLQSSWVIDPSPVVTVVFDPQFFPFQATDILLARSLQATIQSDYATPPLPPGPDVIPDAVLDLGAKWPVKVTEFLTKIKDRFYWFKDESELPKEEPVERALPVAKMEISPAIAEQAKVEIEAQSDAEIAKRKRIERNNEAIMKLFI